MAAQLKGKKSASKETRKILLRQIKKAGTPLKSKQPSDSGIHGARKQIKMARATLRLLREGISRKTYRAENERLRDAAKPLSDARDATVLLATFEDLLNARSGHGDHRRGDTKHFHDDLRRERARTRRSVTGPDGLTQSRQLLRHARTDASKWDVGSKGWSLIGGGLDRVYRQGRDALNAVHRTPTDSAFHEWRKQAKYLRHQLWLLQPIHPEAIGAMVDDLHKLTDQLGDDHDLAVLRVKMAAQPAQSTDEAAEQDLDAQIHRRRVSLQLQSVRLGSQIYRETPRKFCARIHTYWRAWHP